MIILDLIGLAVLIGAFIYFDRRPELLEPDGTARAMTLRGWVDTDEFITEPVDEPTRGASKKAIDISYFGQSDINNLSHVADMTTSNKTTHKEILL